MSSKARNQAFNKDGKKEEWLKDSKSGDDEARANSRSDANVATSWYVIVEVQRASCRETRPLEGRGWG